MNKPDKTQPQPENNRALIYVRVSTEGQENYSPETQETACEGYRIKKGLVVVDVIRETGSAWKVKKRPKYLAMLERIKAEGISHLIFYLPDRITRNLDEWIPLRDINVRLHDAVKNDSFNPQDPRDYKKTRAFEHDVINATESSDQTSRRVSDAWVTQALRGRCPHRRALGLLIGPPVLVGKKWESTTIQDPERAPIIRLLFQHVLTTGERNRSALRRKARDLGLRYQSGRVLGLQAVIDLLENPVYCGRVMLKKKLVKERGDWELIISPEEFDEVQAILGGKRPITKGAALGGKYYGMLKCDLCGRMVVLDPHPRISKRTGEIKTHLYYRCTSGKSEAWYQEHFHQPKCPMYQGPYWKEHEIDEYLLSSIAELYQDPDTLDWIEQEIEEDYRNLKLLNAEEAEALQREFAKNGSLINALTLRLGQCQAILVGSIETQIAHLIEENQRIEARLEELRTGRQAVSLDEIRETLELSKSLKDIYLASSPEKRAKLNRLMFRMIYVARKGELAFQDNDDHYLELGPFYIEWNEPFKTLWEIGFLHGIEAANDRVEEKQTAAEVAENKTWRAWRDSNPRPAAQKAAGLPS
jgi:hypothetical protein